MLSSFGVKNFRLFRKLELDELRQVNLFVGRNNSGKSALLEAIRVYAERASPDLLLGLVRARREGWSRAHDAHPTVRGSSPLRHLFYGHHFPRPDEAGISLEAKGDSASSLQISVGAFIREINADGSVRRIRVTDSDLFGEHSPLELDYALMIEEEGTSRWLMDLDRIPQRFHRSPSVDHITPVQVLPTGNMAPHLIAILWDRISLTDAERIVLEALRLLDPKIEGIALVEDHSARSSERLAIIRTGEFDEPVPLSSMGDGMTRVFQLVLALVNARGGMLVIDEFENGLHWSVQKGVWELVWRMAYSLDVQVFASTHSRDCIRAFSDIWQRSPNAGAFYRLERDSRMMVTATHYPFAALTDSVVSGVEMR